MKKPEIIEHQFLANRLDQLTEGELDSFLTEAVFSKLVTLEITKHPPKSNKRRMQISSSDLVNKLKFNTELYLDVIHSIRFDEPVSFTVNLKRRKSYLLRKHTFPFSLCLKIKFTQSSGVLTVSSNYFISNDQYFYVGTSDLEIEPLVEFIEDMGNSLQGCQT